MAGWEDAVPVVRYDDPYHEWAFKVAEAGGVASTALCPVVVEVLPEPGEGTYREIYAALLQFAGKILNDEEDFDAEPDFEQSKLFRISAFDRQHLIRSIARFETLAGLSEEAGDDDQPQEDAVDGEEPRPDNYEDTLYGRLFVVYSEEQRLFVDEDWSGVYPEYRALFKILYAGRAIRNPTVRESVGRSKVIRVGEAKAMLAVIDDSLGFLNEAFTTPGLDGARFTLFQEIWFQDRELAKLGELKFGARLDRNSIDAVLSRLKTSNEAKLYQSKIEAGGQGSDGKPLNLVIPWDVSSKDHQPLAFPASHGTGVTAMALKALKSFGRSPESLELYGITIPTFVTQDTSGASLGSYLISALRQSMLWNDDYYSDAPGGDFSELPLVMNCSYGFVAGPKDGSGRLNRCLARMLRARNVLGRATALVVPMGNSYNDRTVAHFEVPAEGSVTLDWILAAEDGTPNFMELFAASDAGNGADFEVDLVAQNGSMRLKDGIATARNRGSVRYYNVSGKPAGSFSVWDPNDGERDDSEYASIWEQRAFLALGPTHDTGQGVATVPSGRWKLKISNPQQHPIRLMAAIQRDDAPGSYPVIGRQSYFDSETNWDANGFNMDKPGAFISGKGSASHLASIKSDYVVVAGAGVGKDGPNGQKQVVPSSYASAGPRLMPQMAVSNIHQLGSFDPDFTALADRSDTLPGRLTAGTYSGPEVPISGSSIAAPIVSAYLAANPEWIGKSQSNVTSVADGDRLGTIIRD